MGVKDEMVVHSAKISCTMGDKSSNLRVVSQSKFTINGKKVATMMDFMPGANLFPPVATFGTCKPYKMLPPPAQLCTPIPTGPWQKAFTKKKVNGIPILRGDACLMCARGAGMITIKKSGQ